MPAEGVLDIKSKAWWLLRFCASLIVCNTIWKGLINKGLQGMRLWKRPVLLCL